MLLWGNTNLFFLNNQHHANQDQDGTRPERYADGLI
ncbi:UNVERIFIED_CONTAM: hypothetical protein ABID48_003105 [Paenibacillus phyllosphaerae]